MINTDDRISSQARTDSQARALMCSREPKEDPSAVVPDLRLRKSTVSCTCDVSHPANSDLRSGGQSSRAELLTLPCAAHPRVAPKEARVTSKARSSESNEKGRTNTCPSSTNHSSQTPLASKRLEMN